MLLLSSSAKIQNENHGSAYQEREHKNDKLHRLFRHVRLPRPQAKSSSWLARRLKNHLQAFGLVTATAPADVQEPASEPGAAEQQAPVAESEVVGGANLSFAVSTRQMI